MTPNRGDTFIGRRRELLQLGIALESATSGHGKVVAIGGNPGIGKTALLEEFLEEASKRNSRVLRGSSIEAAYSPPFWLWTQVLRSAIDVPQAIEVFNKLAERQKRSIARVIPELTAPQSSYPIEDFRDVRSRFDLQDSLARFIVGLSRFSPVVVALEDLHLAEESDLSFIEFFAQQLSDAAVLICGTFRSTEVSPGTLLANTLGLLTHLRGFEHIELPGLSDDEMADLVKSASLAPLSPTAVQRLVKRAEGNPLFGRELARAVATPNSDGNQTAPLPIAISDAIGAILEALDMGQRRVLQIAAVIGQRFSLNILAASAGDQLGQCEAAIQAAARHALVVELPASPGTYSFAHALFRQELLDQQSPTDRMRAHADIASALVRLQAGAQKDQLAAIALHHRLGLPVSSIEDAIRHTIRAGDHALQTHAFALAAENFEWVLRSMRDEADGPIRASILERLGAAMLQTGTIDRQRSWDTLSEAVRMFIRIGMNEHAVRAASFPAVIGGLRNVVEVIEDALEVAIPGTQERAWLLARYIVSLAEAGRASEAETALQEALEIAAETGNERLRTRALVHGSQARFRADDPEGCAERGIEAIDSALRIDDPDSVLRVVAFCVESLCSIGRTREAAVQLKRCRDVRNEMADPFAPEIRASYTLAMNTGDWDQIDSLLQQIPEIGDVANLLQWQSLHKSLRLGESYESHRDLLGTAFSTWNIGGYHAAFSILATWLQIRPDAGLQRICEQLRFVDPLTTSESEVRRCGLEVLIALMRAEPPIADHLEVLKTSRSGIIPRTDVPTDRVLGAASLAARDFQDARQHFETSITFCRNAGLKPSLAWSLMDLIRLAIDSPETVDKDESDSAVREALEICAETDMPALAAIIAAHGIELASSEHEVSSLPEPLTPREIEVLRLIAGGLTNQEIADTLVISRYTVIRHVSNIFIKSGSSNRTEAAAYAHRHGLGDS